MEAGSTAFGPKFRRLFSVDSALTDRRNPSEHCGVRRAGLLVGLAPFVKPSA